MTPRQHGSTGQAVPLPPVRNPCRVSRARGLASSPFAHHYSGNRGCFLFLWVLRCFTSPRSLYPPYIFRRESLGRHAAQRGFPIRRSSDQSSVGSSPRLIAAPYVLLRFLVPRHPPCALINLATKMLASTVQFSRYGRRNAEIHRLPVSREARRPAVRCPQRSDVMTPRQLRRERPEGRFPAPSGLNSVPTRPPDGHRGSCAGEPTLY